MKVSEGCCMVLLVILTIENDLFVSFSSKEHIKYTDHSCENSYKKVVFLEHLFFLDKNYKKDIFQKDFK